VRKHIVVDGSVIERDEPITEMSCDDARPIVNFNDISIHRRCSHNPHVRGRMAHAFT